MSNHAVLSTTLSLVALQVASRLFSFALNQLLLRSTTPTAFGVATLQFDTLRDTILFLVREGIRGAVVRTRGAATASENEKRTRPIHLFLSPLILPAFYLFARSTSPPRSDPSSSGTFSRTLVLYAGSTLVELGAESSYLETLVRWETLTTRRVQVEGLAVGAKAVGTLAALKVVVPARALEAYGWGQLAYSLTLFVGLRWAVSSTTRTETDSARDEAQVPSEAKRVDARYFDWDVLGLGWALTKQNIVKQVLTEGDKLAVSKFGKGDDLGGYAVALNYGSLIARIVFQPLEESCRLYFSSLASRPPTASRPTASTSPHVEIATHLSLVLRFYTHLTLILTLLAPPFVVPVLRVLLGPTWASTAGTTLKAYLYSLPFLAFNGLTEAAFQSLADERWLRFGSYWMGVCTVAFASTVYVTMARRDAVDGGVETTASQGLIVANCVNMALRTLFSCRFLYLHFARSTASHPLRSPSPRSTGFKIAKDDARLEARSTAASQGEETGSLDPKVREALDWTTWMPNLSTIVAFLVAGRVCRSSEVVWLEGIRDAAEGGDGGATALGSLARHVGVGAAAGVACLIVIAVTNKAQVKELVRSLQARRERKGTVEADGGKKDQ
ncbi:hypothetical protein JCM10212_000389 [Sporobolomyces blumeae]